MIDIRLLRTEPEAVTAELGRRGVTSAEVEALIAADRSHRELSARRDRLRAQVKEISRQVADARRSADSKLAEQLTARSREFRSEEQALAAEASAQADQLQHLLMMTPNIPASECPEGLSDQDNVVLRQYPETIPPSRECQRVPHWEVGARLGILDLEAGAKMSGSMFPLFKGDGSAMLRALTSFALDHHRDAFLEIRPPTLVRTETMMSTGHLPKFADDAYHLERDDLWAIPTAEVPLASMHRGEILREEDLPELLCAATPCFRREAGSAGRDTRGLLRVHEFEKVELFAFCTPEQAEEVHADILARAELLIQELGLAYRVLDLCAGDLGAASARTFDLEVYAPGCDRWLEVSSISWCSDYQARRANVRFRSPGGGTAFVHTLNGSALAWARVWAAVIETYRQDDGSVSIPKALRPYMGGRDTIS